MSKSTAEINVDQLVSLLRDALLDIEKRYQQNGRSVTDLGVKDVAQRMTAVVPLPSPVNEKIGPFYRSEQVVRILDISRQAVNQQVKRFAILALRTSDDMLVYPTFQFDGRKLVDGLKPVLAEFRGKDVDPWAVAAWLVSPSAALDGASPLEAVRGNYGSTAVRQLARDAMRRWMQ